MAELSRHGRDGKAKNIYHLGEEGFADPWSKDFCAVRQHKLCEVFLGLEDIIQVGASKAESVRPLGQISVVECFYTCSIFVHILLHLKKLNMLLQLRICHRRA